MVKRKGRKSKGKRKSSKGKRKSKRKAKGRSFRGKISYVPCRDSAGKFRSKPTCSR